MLLIGFTGMQSHDDDERDRWPGDGWKTEVTDASGKAIFALGFTTESSESLARALGRIDLRRCSASGSA
jgi:hypothetical protein